MRSLINRADKSSVPPHYLDYIDCERREAQSLFMKCAAAFSSLQRPPAPGDTVPVTGGIAYNICVI